MFLKKVLPLILVVIFALGAFAACNGDEGDPSSSGKTDKTSGDASEQPGDGTSSTDEFSVPMTFSDDPVIISEDPVSSEDPASAPEDESGDESEEESGDESADESEPEESSGSGGDAAKAIVDMAYSLIGTPYKLGGIGPDSFDNSGFVYYIYRQHGYNIPRLASGMIETGEEANREQIVPGDILIFRNEIDGPPAFVAIYVGEGKFIACNKPETPTKLQTMDTPYWQARFICGRHIV